MTRGYATAKPAKLTRSLPTTFLIFWNSQCEIRLNSWTERVQLKGFEWPQWTDLTDAMAAQLSMRARELDLEYNIGKDFVWDALIAYRA